MTNKLNQTPLAATIAESSEENRDQSFKHLFQSPREGSTLHYASLRLPSDVRENAFGALNLTHTLASALIGVQEASVAQTKLEWWHEEIIRLEHNEPRHPACKRSSAWLAGHSQAKTDLTTIIDAATAARFDAPEDDENWTALVSRDYRARLNIVLASIEVPTDAFDLQPVVHSVAWIDILRTLPQRIHHDQVSFPPSLLESFNVNRQQLLQNMKGAYSLQDKKNVKPQTLQEQQPVSALIAEGVNHALTSTNDAIQSEAYFQLKSTENGRFLTTWLQLRAAQLRLWQSAQPNLLRETITVTPLRKWFIAFKHR